MSAAKGRPRVLLLTPGNMNDIMVVRALIERAGPIRGLIADRGYDANHLRRFLAERRTTAVIPSTTSRAVPIHFDAETYKQHNKIERMWCRLKDWRRIATRYDRLARNYLAALALVAVATEWAR